MIGHHAIKDASEVFLLLLLFMAPSELSKPCYWDYAPFPTANQTELVKTLKGWILLDYQVSVPTNLKPDEFCRKLWDVYFFYKELDRMSKVSGENLTQVIQKLMNLTGFVEWCKIKENNCIHFVQRNVSQFLDPIPSLFTALGQHMEEYPTKVDFSNCTIVQCQLDYFTTPVTKQAEQRTSEESLFFTTLNSKQTRLQEEPTPSPQADTSRKHYWWLIWLLATLLFIACVAVRRFQCRQPLQNVPFEPPE